MTIPESFTNNIAGQFYDKTILLYDDDEVTEADGKTHQSVTTSSSFVGNVQFSRLGKFMEDYGLTEKIDISITSLEDVTPGRIIGYDGKYYRVEQVIDNDSHNLILGSQWMLK